MLYKFKSKATGDLIMLGPHGDALLRAIGRAPVPQGIIEPQAMPAAMAAIEQAIAAEESARAQAEAEAAARGETLAPPAADAVPLRRRLWPMVEMLQRAAAAGEPVVWGV